MPFIRRLNRSERMFHHFGEVPSPLRKGIARRNHSRSFIVAGLLSLVVPHASATSLFQGESANQRGAGTLQSAVRRELTSPAIEGLYARTYWSLRNREQPDGFLPESLTGAYAGMFPRTVGAYALLMIETGQEEAAERSLDCVLRALAQTGYERVPRVLAKHDGNYVIKDDEAQIDGQAHLILGWSRLALARGRTAFEDRTWKQVSALLSSGTDRQYLQSGPYPSQNGLVLNVAFEHSREGRYWETWDLLTQSFTGAALRDMIQVAWRRGDTEAATLWQKRLDILSAGITKSLTTKREGKLTYLEMRLPNSAAGTPYLGLGWVAFSPFAAGWIPDPQVMANTVEMMQRTQVKITQGLAWMPTDGYADGSFSNEIIGKGQAWEMEFARTQGNWQRVDQILMLIQTVNTPRLYMEGAWLENAHYQLSQRLTDADLPKMEAAQWRVKDAGNGEQTVWFCWEMARLRQQFGLSAEPPEPAR